MVRLAKASDADRIRAIKAIKDAEGISFAEASRRYTEQRLERVKEAFQSFTDEVNEAAQTFEQVAEALPQHRRELFWDLPLRQAVDLAVRHFAPRHLAPRQRGRCERRPRVRAVRRRRSSRTTRAGPLADPDLPPRSPAALEGAAR
jgi:hypothetical protein